VNEFRNQLREQKIRYRGISVQKDMGIVVRFADAEQRQAAIKFLATQYPEFSTTPRELNNIYLLDLTLLPSAQQEIERYAVEQSMTTLRNRVNELGVAEAV